MKNITIMVLIALIAFAGCSTTSNRVQPKTNEEELGRQAFESGDYQSSANYYSQWLSKYPESTDVLVERGRAYNKLQKYDLALKDFELAIEKNPADLRSQVYRCGILVYLKNKTVPATLAQLIADPRFPQLGAYEKFLAYVLDGQVKNLNQESEGALSSLNQALQLHDAAPDAFQRVGAPAIHRLALRERASAYFDLGHYQKAADDMEIYLQLAEQAKGKCDPQDFHDLVLALYMADEHAKCKQWLPRLSPKDRQSLANTFGDFFTEEMVSK